jgi:LCP family protein required for cell wall assembly
MPPIDQAHRATPPAARLLLLNAVFPGLGHLVAGQRRWALILALPVLIVLAVGVILVLGGDITSLAARLFDPVVLGVLLGLQTLLVLWRLGALAAVRQITPIRATAQTIVAGAVAVAIVLLPQLWVAGLTLDARDSAAEVFAPVGEGGAWVPDASAPPVASDDPDFGTEASPSYSVEPSASSSVPASASPSPTPAIPRVSVLLIGIDSGVGRNTALTDTMIVASLDPVGKTVSMASIPRDMVDVPLPDGRTFRGKINSLVSYVRWHPGKFPGAKDGQSVLAAALGQLLDLKIDMWAQVNLPGFVDLVDAVGGINIDVTDGFCDYRYKEYGIKGFNITPGRYHFDGEHALGYARIRKAAGESDFTRAARQQEVIAALRDRIVKGGLLENPARFLKGIGHTITTNIKPSVIADWIDIASKVGRSDTFRTVIGHPYVRGTSDSRGSIQEPNLTKIRALAARLFTAPGVRPEGFTTMPSPGSGRTKTASSSSTCGIVKATPKPKPTPKPAAGATPTPQVTPEPATPAPATPAPPTPEPPTPEPPTPEPTT